MHMETWVGWAALAFIGSVFGFLLTVFVSEVVGIGMTTLEDALEEIVYEAEEEAELAEEVAEIV